MTEWENEIKATHMNGFGPIFTEGRVRLWSQVISPNLGRGPRGAHPVRPKSSYCSPDLSSDPGEATLPTAGISTARTHAISGWQGEGMTWQVSPGTS